uniref:Uncharacterized protein n=1 Tax=Noctiluca scintillans TaxID=2966 RepID=A0A7S1AXZ7_NOCSC|mmetsp:Transcript_6483/g.18134  ORF Transcript_6483/g.18134 Transcript_6483/m.18134 type:complete len:834 (+) Transcript_6483:49-2550(+)
MSRPRTPVRGVQDVGDDERARELQEAIEEMERINREKAETRKKEQLRQKREVAVLKRRIQTEIKKAVLEVKTMEGEANELKKAVQKIEQAGENTHQKKFKLDIAQNNAVAKARAREAEKTVQLVGKLTAAGKSREKLAHLHAALKVFQPDLAALENGSGMSNKANLSPQHTTLQLEVDEMRKKFEDLTEDNLKLRAELAAMMYEVKVAEPFVQSAEAGSPRREADRQTGGRLPAHEASVRDVSSPDRSFASNSRTGHGHLPHAAGASGLDGSTSKVSVSRGISPAGGHRAHAADQVSGSRGASPVGSGQVPHARGQAPGSQGVSPRTNGSGHLPHAVEQVSGNRSASPTGVGQMSGTDVSVRNQVAQACGALPGHCGSQAALQASASYVSSQGAIQVSPPAGAFYGGLGRVAPATGSNALGNSLGSGVFNASTGHSMLGRNVHGQASSDGAHQSSCTLPAARGWPPVAPGGNPDGSHPRTPQRTAAGLPDVSRQASRAIVMSGQPGAMPGAYLPPGAQACGSHVSRSASHARACSADGRHGASPLSGVPGIASPYPLGGSFGSTLGSTLSSTTRTILGSSLGNLGSTLGGTLHGSSPQLNTISGSNQVHVAPRVRTLSPVKVGSASYSVGGAHSSFVGAGQTSSYIPGGSIPGSLAASISGQTASYTPMPVASCSSTSYPSQPVLRHAHLASHPSLTAIPSMLGQVYNVPVASPDGRLSPSSPVPLKAASAVHTQMQRHARRSAPVSSPTSRVVEPAGRGCGGAVLDRSYATQDGAVGERGRSTGRAANDDSKSRRPATSSPGRFVAAVHKMMTQATREYRLQQDAAAAKSDS